MNLFKGIWQATEVHELKDYLPEKVVETGQEFGQAVDSAIIQFFQGVFQGNSESEEDHEEIS